MKIKILSVLLTIIWIYGCGELSVMTQTYKVKNIINNGEILELNNGVKVKLAGVKILENYKNTTKSYIKDLISGCRVILIYDETLKDYEYEGGKVKLVYLYLWGNKKLNISNLSSVEKKGFTDVRVGWGLQKGIAINLNAHLIREGYCDVDLSRDFDLKDEFLMLQNEAKQNLKGLWNTK